MGLLDGLAKQVAKRMERRALREAENAVTKKIKHVLFGEKEDRVDLHPLVEYRRLELSMHDVRSCYLRRDQFDWPVYFNADRKKRAVGVIRRMRELYSRMLAEERPKTHEPLMIGLETMVR